MTLDATTEELLRATDASPPGARIRWAGIVWGAFFSALAFAGLWIVGSADRRDDVAGWFEQLTGPTIVGVSAFALGGLLLIAGLVGLLRRAQKLVAERSDTV